MCTPNPVARHLAAVAATAAQDFRPWSRGSREDRDFPSLRRRPFRLSNQRWSRPRQHEQISARTQDRSADAFGQAATGAVTVSLPNVYRTLCGPAGLPLDRTGSAEACFSMITRPAFQAQDVDRARGRW
jgi:hypothetical protein